MNFLVDAQLPRKLAAWLISAGHDAIHTLDLAKGNRATDQEVIDAADQQQRVVVTKDADFVDSHLLHGRPSKLLLISIGNVGNRELETLITAQISAIVRELQTSSFLELGRTGIVVRG